MRTRRSAAKDMVRRRWFRPLTAASLLTIFIANSAFADLAKQHLSYDRLMLPGGRAAILGGAYTALSNDPSGLFYNPAGIVQTTHNQLSLNTWSTFRSQVVFKEAVLGQDFTESSNTKFGGFAGGLFRFKPFTLGYVISTLDKRNINQNDYFRDLSTVNEEVNNFTRIHQESNSYDMFGASVALPLGTSWSIGAAGFYYDRSIEAMDYQQVEFNGGKILIQESKIKIANQGLHSLFGLHYHGDKLSLGLSVRTGQILVNSGSLSFNTVSFQSTASPPELNNYQTDDYGYDDEVIPTLYRLGAAWHPSKYLLLTSEVSFSDQVDVTNTSPNRKATLNYALGFELGLGSWRLLTGVFSNNSIFDEIQADANNLRAHLDYVGRTVGMSINTKTYELFLGYIRQSGTGSAQIISDTMQQQDMIASIENALLSWTLKL